MATTKRPNILIVMTDHQRGDTVLPEHPARTPRMDAFAAQGLTFTEAHCPTPHCCPSRATFQTGLYPSRHGVWNNVCNDQALSRGLAEGVRCWSEDLAEAGYRMAWSGKWHVSVEEGPGDRGWGDVRFVSGGKGDFHAKTWEAFERDARQPEPGERPEATVLRPGYGPWRCYGDHSWQRHAHDEKAVSGGLDALGDLAGEADPWCLFVGLIGPHDPYDAPSEFVDLYDLDDVPLPVSYADRMDDKPAVYRRMRRQIFDQLSEREIRDAIRHFWAYCSYLDHKFGQLLDALEASGQADDTLVLFCSDHGDYCGEHGLFAKGIPCFRGAYHVPAVVRWPAGLALPGRREQAFVSLADFAPTFLDVAGVRAERHFTGASLLPFLQGRQPATWRDDLHTQCNGVELYYTQRSVRTADWKYVHNGFDFDELYDLRNDPDEMTNLASLERYRPAVQEMCRRMWRFARRENDTATCPYITTGLAPFGPAEAFRD